MPKHIIIPNTSGAILAAATIADFERWEVNPSRLPEADVTYHVIAGWQIDNTDGLDADERSAWPIAPTYDREAFDICVTAIFTPGIGYVCGGHLFLTEDRFFDEVRVLLADSHREEALDRARRAMLALRRSGRRKAANTILRGARGPADYPRLADLLEAAVEYW